ncbi:hypothetical protein ELE36_13175 [Pseudolysobacter antarcticus]|uniref:DUF1304 domain-containing protein n=1 Tax=Pseudolysobacter antarcticus TaxID=2511995 RepID=A0A411HQB3_9GAMM|nr:hypothetical protein ELE36_13175 [Pseudolysobacter antarcticus]
MLASLLIAASAAIILLLGIVHLAYTFFGTRLHPRDANLIVQMQAVTLTLTRQTTIWRAWIGFNASHSFGAISFGLIYGFLALAHADLLLRSPFLLVLGMLLLTGYMTLAWCYWFSIPFRGIVLSTLLYIAALITLCF